MKNINLHYLFFPYVILMTSCQAEPSYPKLPKDAEELVHKNSGVVKHSDDLEKCEVWSVEQKATRKRVLGVMGNKYSLPVSAKELLEITGEAAKENCKYYFVKRPRCVDEKLIEVQYNYSKSGKGVKLIWILTSSGKHSPKELQCAWGIDIVETSGPIENFNIGLVRRK